MRRVLLDSGDTTLDVLIEPDTDLDSEFLATDAETGERLRIKGWMIENIEDVAP